MSGGTDPVVRAGELLGVRARRDVAIGPLTTYRVGGRASLFLEAEDLDDLRLAARAVGATGVPVLVVGNGSNLLVAEEGFEGLAVRLVGSFSEVELLPAGARAGGAALLPVIARQTAAAGLRGFEWAVGVPGSIGGAVRMNSGGHGSEMSSVLRSVRVFDLRSGEDEVLPVASLDLGYRRSSVRADQVVIWAELALTPGDRGAAEAEIAEIVRWRREHQPGGANAGSVWTNPATEAAGSLVERAGCKGMRWGSAQVSAKHANFIQVDDGGLASDVLELMVQVWHRVHDRFGVSLVPETRMVGFEARSDLPWSDDPQVEVEG